jgi:glutathione S-transferase
MALERGTAEMMKLYYSPASPFVRKVMACAILRGLDGRIERIPTDPHSLPEALLRVNPLSKVPCLVLEDGTAVFDSPVICEVLDGMGEAPHLFPAPGTPARLKALVRQALADGIMDAAVARRGQQALPQDEGRQRFDARQKGAIDRALSVAEADLPEALADIGSIALACALGYLDFRFAHEPWRESHPRLAHWFATVSVLPLLARTVPTAP